MRMGIFPKGFLKKSNPIWIHAVSVGEVNAVKSLIRELRKEYPEKNLVISTVTETANTIAKLLVEDDDRAIFLPLDLSFIIKRVIRKIRPSLFIIAETEIWPNLIWRLEREKVPIILVNGRISDQSFKGYKIVRFLLKGILRKISLFCMQTERDKKRILSLGVLKEKVFLTGNMKFDTIDYRDFEEDYRDYRQKLDLKSTEELIVAGSTHPGEEEIILEVYEKLSVDFPSLKLLIAPRHPERAGNIAVLAIKHGFNPVRISQLTNQPTGQKIIFILDTIGKLISFYAISTVIFVGGSLVKRGGHNILEPAFFRKPIIFGPYMFNFRDICDLFLSNKAAIKVDNKQELFEEVKNLLDNPSEKEELGKRARILILENQGAVEKNISLIRSLITFKTKFCA